MNSPRLLIAAILLLGIPVRGQDAADRPPNILFLFADDQRRDTIAELGNTHIETPNLDRLVRSGFRFENNYCMGSRHGAVCAPSRAMLMSGRTLHRVRDDLRGVVTLGQTLASAGYTTFATGKWHNQRDALVRSFRYGKSVMLGGMSDHNKVPIVDLVQDGTAISERRTGEKHSSELFADAAVGFLQAHARERADRPFFAYVAFTAPHDPRDPPLEYREAYYDKRPPLPGNFRPQHGWNFDEGTLTLRDEVLAAWPRDPDVIRDQLAEYYGLITHMDAQIGRILAALEKTGLARRTIIVFSADHGLAIGSHGLLGKQNLYEHSMGCPLVISGPGIPRGGASRSLTYLLDLYPTLCGFAGAEVPESVEGRDLGPVIRGERDRVRDSLFLLYRDSQRAVRDARYKLIRFTKINKTLLFDLQEDPDETRDLAADPEYADRIFAMTALLGRWQERTADAQPLTSEHPGPETIDLAGRSRKPDRHQPAWIREKYFGGK
jgi:arylsulfatase A-like enzyme